MRRASQPRCAQARSAQRNPSLHIHSAGRRTRQRGMAAPRRICRWASFHAGTRGRTRCKETFHPRATAAMCVCLFGPSAAARRAPLSCARGCGGARTAAAGGSVRRCTRRRQRPRRKERIRNRNAEKDVQKVSPSAARCRAVCRAVCARAPRSSTQGHCPHATARRAAAAAPSPTLEGRASV